MSGLETPSYLVDGIKVIGLHNGVARVQFFQLGAEGKPGTAVELAIPLAQGKAIGEAILKAVSGK